MSNFQLRIAKKANTNFSEMVPKLYAILCDCVHLDKE